MVCEIILSPPRGRPRPKELDNYFIFSHILDFISVHKLGRSRRLPDKVQLAAQNTMTSATGAVKAFATSTSNKMRCIDESSMVSSPSDQDLVTPATL